MRVNERTAIATQDLILVPYARHHVEKYHSWMQNPELQELTASDPLTLAEEYSMQESWRKDADKLTFIVCSSVDRSLVQGQDQRATHPLSGGGRKVNGQKSALISHFSETENDRMIGDINLFLYEAETDGNSAEDHGEGNDVSHLCGEIELMIAETRARGRGLGGKILTTFLQYVVDNLDVIMKGYIESTLVQSASANTFNSPGRENTSEAGFMYFRVKINEGNTRSLRLFERTGFIRTSPTANYFGEVELRLGVDDLKARWLRDPVEQPVYEQYVDENGQAYP